GAGRSEGGASILVSSFGPWCHRSDRERGSRSGNAKVGWASTPGIRLARPFRAAARSLEGRPDDGRRTTSPSVKEKARQRPYADERNGHPARDGQAAGDGDAP